MTPLECGERIFDLREEITAIRRKSQSDVRNLSPRIKRGKSQIVVFDRKTINEIDRIRKESVRACAGRRREIFSILKREPHIIFIGRGEDVA